MGKQVDNILLATDIDKKDIKSKINHFHVRIIETRLNSSGLTNLQKVKVIDSIIKNIPNDES